MIFLPRTFKLRVQVRTLSLIYRNELTTTMGNQSSKKISGKNVNLILQKTNCKYVLISFPILIPRNAVTQEELKQLFITHGFAKKKHLSVEDIEGCLQKVFGKESQGM